MFSTVPTCHLRQRPEIRRSHLHTIPKTEQAVGRHVRLTTPKKPTGEETTRQNLAYLHACVFITARGGSCNLLSDWYKA